MASTCRLSLATQCLLVIVAVWLDRNWPLCNAELIREHGSNHQSNAFHPYAPPVRCDRLDAVVELGPERVSHAAARETQRYLYMATGILAQLRKHQNISESIFGLTLTVKGLSQPSQEMQNMHPSNDIGMHCPLEDIGGSPAHRLCVVTRGDALHLVATASHAHALGAATGKIASALGVRISLVGDYVTDKHTSSERPLPRRAEATSISPSCQSLLDSLRALHMRSAAASPFQFSGLHPFHDFSEGVDWWNENAYKHMFVQMSKLGFNFFGLHSYCESQEYCEPLVWVGLQSELSPDGKPTAAYPAAWQTTLRGPMWGYRAINASQLPFGAATAFDRDCYGSSDINDHIQGACPYPGESAPQTQLDVFDRVGSLLNNSFSLAKELGIRTGIGNGNGPLLSSWWPIQHRCQQSSNVSAAEYYKGIFTRIAKTHPLDYYWISLPEGWAFASSVDPKDVDAMKEEFSQMQQAWEAVNPPFSLAQYGWTLGPPPDRAAFDEVLPSSWSMATLDRHLGNDPTEPAFAKVTHHKNKWTIPWLEDDPGLTALQFWVNRTLEHADQAIDLGVNGLMGIHWRVRQMEPAIMALSHRVATQDPVLAGDIWKTWCNDSFGSVVGPKAAVLFESIDSYNMPRPVDWSSSSPLVQSGPGRVSPSNAACNLSAYSFVDTFGSWRPLLSNDTSMARERFDFWADTLKVMRNLAQVSCSWATVNDCIDHAEAQPDPAHQQSYARTYCVPAMKALNANITTLMTNLLQTVSTTAELGTFYNLFSASLAPGIYGLNSSSWHAQSTPASTSWRGSSMTSEGFGSSGKNYTKVPNAFCSGLPESHVGNESLSACKALCDADLNCLCFDHGAYHPNFPPQTRGTCRLSELSAATSPSGANFTAYTTKKPEPTLPTVQRLQLVLNATLPPDALPSHIYAGRSRMVVLNARTSLYHGEPFKVHTIVLSKTTTLNVTLYYRDMGSKGQFMPKTIPLSRHQPSSQVFISEASLSKDTELYVVADLADGSSLSWPPGSPTEPGSLHMVLVNP